MEGTLASWALPKGLPLEPGEKYLAVHVEDHPMEYADFSGVIPKGQYGAGTMEIWDRGRYELVERKKDGGLTVRLNGKRLSGLWTLVPAKLGGEERNWLLIKKHDTGEQPSAAAPAGYAPMLATAAERLPTRGEWRFEVKLDGYRAIARLEGGEASLASRGGNDFGGRFAEIARALPHALRTSDCVVDGELCMLDERGRPDFGLMQRGEGSPAYYVFDLLELERQPCLTGRSSGGAAVGGAAGRGQPAGAAVDPVRRRSGVDEGGAGAGSGGRGRQAAGLAVPTGPPKRGLGEGEDARGRRVPDRGIHEGNGIP